MEKENILVISGGSVDYTWAAEWVKTVRIDYVIAADSGLVHADRLGLEVDLLLGDYDSCNQEVLKKYKNNTKTLTYPKEKDYTDTHIALQKAVERDPSQIYLLGTTGTRYDHTMTNIYNMLLALKAGISCCMLDPHNKIYLQDKTFTIDKKNQYGSYVSFLPVTPSVTLSLTGMKYPLDHYELCYGSSICQSNEIKEDKAMVEIDNGTLITFETKD